MKGIPNPGLVCYANAALQCLAFCPHLTNYFLSGRAKQDVCPKRKRASSLALALSAFVNDYWSTVGTSEADAKDVIEAFRQACRGFSPTQQHDAHEALVCLLDKVHEGLSRLKPGQLAVTLRPEVRKKPWAESLKGLCSVVSEVFRGQLEVHVEAPGYTALTHDHFTCLSLAVCGSLTQCFSTHFGTERVDDFKVGEKRVSARVSKRFTYLPRILVVHLKRFDGTDKISKFVDYSTELDLAAYCVPGCEHHYQLFAVCMHRGGTEDGHYTVYGEVKGRWYVMDDETVEQVRNINDIVQRDAYVLFYKRL